MTSNHISYLIADLDFNDVQCASLTDFSFLVFIDLPDLASCSLCQRISSQANANRIRQSSEKTLSWVPLADPYIERMLLPPSLSPCAAETE